MCDEHEDGKYGAFKAQKTKGVTLAIWFISQILNEGQAVNHSASGRIVTCYTHYLDNKNKYMCLKFFLYYCQHVVSVLAHLLNIQSPRSNATALRGLRYHLISLLTKHIKTRHYSSLFSSTFSTPKKVCCITSSILCIKPIKLDYSFSKERGLTGSMPAKIKFVTKTFSENKRHIHENTHRYTTTHRNQYIK